ncbi:PTS-dependent dihydroxyacetone kinase phosphotransferase subunit DhaM [Solirubrobacter sp. CPCC 204708]|nr:PTS-dependent dihydroxyacetone kinase phosphotransferase subunit DhaM [Solirubrobacter deserti]
MGSRAKDSWRAGRTPPIGAATSSSSRTAAVRRSRRRRGRATRPSGGCSPRSTRTRPPSCARCCSASPRRLGPVVGIVVVSHSADIAAGVVALAGQMAGPDVPLEGAGGTADGGLGTDADRIEAALDAAERGDGVIVLGDLGSAILTARTVLEDREGVRLVDAPLVEGAVAAAVSASAGLPLDAVARAAEEARVVPKF